MDVLLTLRLGPLIDKLVRKYDTQNDAITVKLNQNLIKLYKCVVYVHNEAVGLLYFKNHNLSKHA